VGTDGSKPSKLEATTSIKFYLRKIKMSMDTQVCLKLEGPVSAMFSRYQVDSCTTSFIYQRA
jgi:hypothetical protein